MVGFNFPLTDPIRDVMFAFRQWYIENEKEEEYEQAKKWAFKDLEL